MTHVHVRARRHWQAFAALALLLVAQAAPATPIALLGSDAAGFVGQAQGGPLDTPVLVGSYAQFLSTFGASTAGLADPYLAPSVAAFFVNGGLHLYVVRVSGADDASLIGTDGGAPGARTGLQALRDVPAVAMVAAPGAVSLAVQSALLAHCESMGNRVAILDPASANDMNAVIAQRAGIGSADGFGALYFPWVLAAPAGDSLQLPPSGFVAGVMARSTPPTTPTGVIASATGVTLPLNTTQDGQLSPLGIDTIRFFSGQGVRIWGGRTLASNLDWQYLAVRRAGCAIASSIQAGTAWCLPLPNDAALWTQLTTDLNGFMMDLFVAGWFKGTTPSQAFFVKCDATTMTAQDIADGRTIMLVGFAPITPANFVVMRIVQSRPPSASVAPGAQSFTLGAPHPNPFTPQTGVAFDLPASAAVTLRIHDVGGRLVRTLAGGETLAAGHHEQPWDGRDDAGGPSPRASTWCGCRWGSAHPRSGSRSFDDEQPGHRSHPPAQAVRVHRGRRRRLLRRVRGRDFRPDRTQWRR